MSDASKFLSAAVSCAAIGLTILLLWPSRQSLELVSPDGAHRLTLTVTDAGAELVLQGRNGGDIKISAMDNNAPTIVMNGHSDGYLGAPQIVLMDTQGVRIIRAD